jgi:hypothetical protein
VASYRIPAHSREEGRRRGVTVYCALSFSSLSLFFSLS